MSPPTKTVSHRQTEHISPHESFMRAAIRLSLSKMRVSQGGPFGAVIVRNGRIIGRGWNRVTSANDPTAHAEIVAIRSACRRLSTFRLEGCTIYTTCEPCPMCLAAIYWARIETVYFGNTREDAARIAFDDAVIYRQLALPLRKRSLVMNQLLREEALAAFTEWEQKADRVSY